MPLKQCLLQIKYCISFPRLYGVITNRLKEKGAALNLKFILSTMQCFDHTHDYPHMAKKNLCNIFSEHCFKSLCISNLYFKSNNNFFTFSTWENNVKWGKYAKNTRKNVEKQTLSLQIPSFLEQPTCLIRNRSKKLIRV